MDEEIGGYRNRLLVDGWGMQNLWVDGGWMYECVGEFWVDEWWMDG